MSTVTSHLLFPVQMGFNGKKVKCDQVILKQVSGNTNKASMNIEAFKKGQTLTKILKTLIKAAVLEDGQEVDMNEKAINDMTSSDRIMLVVDSWKSTYGKTDWVLPHKCEECSGGIAVKFDFEAPKRPAPGMELTREIDDYSIGFAFPDGNSETAFAKQMTDSEKSGELGELHKQMLETFCKTVNGEKFSYDDAPAPMINAVEHLAKDQDLLFGYETSMAVECHKCGHEQQITCPIQDSNFLFDKPGNE